MNFRALNFLRIIVINEKWSMLKTHIKNWRAVKNYYLEKHSELRHIIEGFLLQIVYRTYV